MNAPAPDAARSLSLDDSGVGSPAVPPPVTRGAGEFAALYEATLRPLRRYLASLLGQNTHDAHDIAHDAYLRTYAAMHTQTVANPKALLFTAARNLAFTYRTRRALRMMPTEDNVIEFHSPMAPATDVLVADRERTAVLREAILALPPGCRQVLILRNLDGLSYAEIATQLGISLSGVEKQLQRALRLLREEMKARSE